MPERSAPNTGNSDLPPDLGFFLEVLTPQEEKDLIALIEASGLTYSSYDPDNRRSSVAFGWDYDFMRDTFIPCDPMPKGFQPIREKAAARAGIQPQNFAECLLNRYEKGAVIQPHLDKPVWDMVVGISLGARTVMRFRNSASHSGEPIDVTLPPRSLYVLRGAARHQYTHEIPPVDETRWSITFRSMSEAGLRNLENATTTG